MKPQHEDRLLKSFNCPLQDLQRWLRWLKQEVGADGWRFDFVKGYPGTHVRDYIRASDPVLAVGEFWDTCAYDEEGTLLPDQVCFPDYLNMTA